MVYFLTFLDLVALLINACLDEITRTTLNLSIEITIDLIALIVLTAHLSVTVAFFMLAIDDLLAHSIIFTLRNQTYRFFQKIIRHSSGGILVTLRIECALIIMASHDFLINFTDLSTLSLVVALIVAAFFQVQTTISEHTAIIVVTNSFTLLAIVTLRIILLLKACIDDQTLPIIVRINLFTLNALITLILTGCATFNFGIITLRWSLDVTIVAALMLTLFNCADYLHEIVC